MTLAAASILAASGAALRRSNEHATQMQARTVAESGATAALTALQEGAPIVWSDQVADAGQYTITSISPPSGSSVTAVWVITATTPQGGSYQLRVGYTYVVPSASDEGGLRKVYWPYQGE